MNSFFQRAVHAARESGRLAMWSVTGQWEGNERDRFRDRPTAVKASEDLHLDYGTRENLIAESRSLCQTFGLTTRILRQYANYVVGSCKVQFLTRDKGWNDRTEESCWNWSQVCDYRQTLTLQQKARLSVVGMLRDGDSFHAKIEEDGYPQLQDIEADRVGNYSGGLVNVDQAGIIGGVLLDRRSRPRAYRTWERAPKYESFVNPKDLPASQVMHVFDPLRFDATRGVTHFHAALNRLRSLKSTLDAEQVAQDTASRIAMLVKSASGPPRVASGGIPVLSSDKNAKGNDILVRDLSKGAVMYQYPGDSAEAFMSSRPGDGWLKLAEVFIREIALSLDLPFEFVWNMAGLTGPAVRLMSKQAERTFRAKQDILEGRFLNPSIAWWVNFEMQAGRLPFNAEWYKFKVQRPAHPTIDAGRDSAANMNEFDHGLITEEEMAEERGEDATEIRAKRKDEVREKLQDAQDLAAEFDLDIAQVMSLLGRPNIAAAIAEEKTAEIEAQSNQPALAA